MRMLRVNDWDDHQTYRKDRGIPPWIKLYRKLLRSLKWIKLTTEQRGQLVSLWLLAADYDGCVPDDEELVQDLCMLREGIDLDVFVRAGFLRRDANVTPLWRQGDTPKAEAEADTEADGYQERGATA